MLQIIFTGVENTQLAGKVLTANPDDIDSDLDGDTLTVIAISSPAGASFTYTISDGNGAIDTATAILSFTCTNDDPTARDDAFWVTYTKSFSENVIMNSGGGYDRNPDYSGTNDEGNAYESIAVTQVKGTPLL